MRAATLRRSLARPPAGLPAERVPARSVPYEHSFVFGLSGTPQQVHRSTVTVSIEAAFTAISIGYGLSPSQVTPVPVLFGPSPSEGSVTLRSIQFGDLMANLETALNKVSASANTAPPLDTALRSGVKLNAALAAAAMVNDGNAAIDNASLPRLFEVVSTVASSGDVQFLYTLFDEASGREFQSGPLLSTAALGSADGKRPFRYFAQPITFAPRTTIRMEVTELITQPATLYVVLHGYKELPAPNAPVPPRDRPPRRRSR